MAEETIEFVLTVPDYGETAETSLRRQLDFLRQLHIDSWQPVTITVPREVVSQVLNALRHRGRRRAADTIRAALAASEPVPEPEPQTKSIPLTWAPHAINVALARLLDFRDGQPLHPGSQHVAVAIDALRAIGAEVGSDE